METLGVLATWAPATAMLPLPLALLLPLKSPWQQHQCSFPRRDEAPVPPLLPALVALLLLSRRFALPL